MVDTLDLLAKHHRGPEFSDLMVSSAPGRFSPAFWQFWQQFIAPALGDPPQLLDLGTGPGTAILNWAQRYPNGKFIGVDLMPYMLDKARECLADVPDVELLQADLHNPQLQLHQSIALGSIDVAQAVVVLHEMIQPIRLLQAAYAWLKPGGRLLIVDWVRAPIRLYFDLETEAKLFSPEAELDYLEDRLTHFFEHNRFSADDLVWMLEHVGFKILGQELYNQDRFVRIAATKV